MALGNHDRSNWFWRLPMTLLALRTTVKTDLGASPSDLVYGEGVSVPGQLLPSAPIPEEELIRRQRRTLSHLRMEVERMQPTPTSAHRRPPVHVPEELSTCTHVFVLRGGVQPTLTTPYDGPYRVLDRTPEGFKVEFPGRASDIVALSRLRPAIMDLQEDQGTPRDDQEDLDDAIPPSPPPPGRRPGPRTRFPEPTDRVTRSRTANQPASNQPCHPRDESVPCTSRDAPESPVADNMADIPSPSPATPDRRTLPHELSQEARTVPRILSPATGTDSNGAHDPLLDPPAAPMSSSPPVPAPSAPGPARRFTSRQDRNFSSRGGPVPDLWQEGSSRQPTNGSRDLGGAPPPPKRVLSFSKPHPGNFSYQRRRPDVSALRAIIQSHLS